MARTRKHLGRKSRRTKKMTEMSRKIRNYRSKRSRKTRRGGVNMFGRKCTCVKNEEDFVDPNKKPWWKFWSNTAAPPSEDELATE